MSIVLWSLAVLACGVAVYGYVQWSQWEEYRGTAVGTRVAGDTTVPATNTLTHLYLRLVGWRMTAVLEVPLDAVIDGYRVGYRATDGTAKVHVTVYRDRQFRMRIGREDPIFFAVTPSGLEVPLTLIARVPFDDPAYEAIPLH